MKCVWASGWILLVHVMSVDAAFAQAEKKIVPPPAPRKTDTVSVAGGDRQTVARQTGKDGVLRAAFAPLRVVVKDAAGKPIAGTRIDWSCIAAEPLACDVGAKKFSLTDAKGVATLNALDGGTSSANVTGGEGSVKVQGSYGKTLLKASFNLSVAAPPPLKPTLTILSGDGQAMPLVERSNHEIVAKFLPVAVVLKDPSGRPLANQTISWKCAPKCQPESITSTTDAEGKSKSDWWGGEFSVYANAEGPLTLNATAGEATTTFQFTTLPRPAPAYKLSIVSGDKQEVAVGPYGALYAPFVVKLVDADGKPLAKRWVGAQCAPVGGACRLKFYGNVNTLQTREDGTASFEQLTTPVITGAHGAILYNGATAGTVRVVADDSNPVVFDLKVKK